MPSKGGRTTARTVRGISSGLIRGVCLACCWRKTELDGVLGERWGGRSDGSCGEAGQAGDDGA
jgi:hypothetical protein